MSLGEGAYKNIQTKIAGLKVGTSSRVESKRTAQTDGIPYGLPVFGYSGNDKDVFLFRKNKAVVTWDADFVTSNKINMTIDGVAITEVDFTTDHDTTMDLVKAAIEAVAPTAVVTLTDGTNNREVTIVIEDGINRAITEAVTGGASQASGTIVYSSAMLFVGISLFDQQENAVKKDLDGNVLDAADAEYTYKDAMNSMIDGWIIGEVADAVNNEDQAYVVAAAGADQGKFTNETSGNTILNGVIFKETLTAAGLGKIRILK
jgi:hypothetical protein